MARVLTLFRRTKVLAVVLVPVAALFYATPVLAAAPPSLGAAGSFAALAGSGAVTCTTGMAVKGNVGAFPGTTITGFRPSCTLTGTIHAGDAMAKNAHQALLAAYTSVAARNCTQTVSQAAFTNQALSYAPGVICFPAAATFTNVVLTLAGPANGVWIFKIGTSGTGALTGTGLTVAGSGKPCNANVTWWTNQAATLTGSTFQGTILAGTSITVTGGAFMGRALAQVAVTLTGPGMVSACGNGTHRGECHHDDKTKNSGGDDHHGDCDDHRGDHHDDGDCCGHDE